MSIHSGDKHDDDDENDRPTISPPFDMESFARLKTGPTKAEAPPPSQRDAPVSESAPTRRVAEPEASSPSSIEAALRDAAERPVILEQSIEDPVKEMRLAFQRGDHAGAIEIADLILIEDPTNPDALQWKTACVAALEYIYAAKLRPLERVPVYAASRSQADAAGLDHRAAYLLAFVDGCTSMRDIVDSCGMPRVDALRIFEALVRHELIAFR